jgi:hypothetical protein
MLPTKHITDQKLTLCLLTHTPNSPLPPLPINLPSLFPKLISCYQRTFTRRTSGHCLGTFSAVNFSHSHPLPSYKFSACHSLHTPLPLPSSSPSFSLEGLTQIFVICIGVRRVRIVMVSNDGITWVLQ